MDAATYQPYLALSLLNLARYHLDTDNLDQASLVIAEGVELNQQLLLTRTQEPTFPIVDDFFHDRSKNQGLCKVLQDAEDARSIFDQIFEE